jgi:hypothetical protein
VSTSPTSFRLLSPLFCVGIGSENPALAVFNLPEATVPGDPEFGIGLLEYGYAHEFDFGYLSNLLLDNGTGLPLHFITRNYEIPVVPCNAEHDLVDQYKRHIDT